MRSNRFVALATGMSRRAADKAIAAGDITIDGHVATAGSAIEPGQRVAYKSKPLSLPDAHTTIMLNKPVGYVCSRSGQGSKTVYDLLPPAYHHLKPVGRLDKDSSGLLLLTDDGVLANELTHPSHQKDKVYWVRLDKPLSTHHQKQIEAGVALSDGPSRLQLKPLSPGYLEWEVTLHEGRNRQIRRTFEALGYQVIALHRTVFGPYNLGALSTSTFTPVKF